MPAALNTKLPRHVNGPTLAFHGQTLEWAAKLSQQWRFGLKKSSLILYRSLTHTNKIDSARPAITQTANKPGERSEGCQRVCISAFGHVFVLLLTVTRASVGAELHEVRAGTRERLIVVDEAEMGAGLLAVFSCAGVGGCRGRDIP